VKDSAREAVSRATDRAGLTMMEQKDRAARRLSSVGSALRQAARSLDEDDRAAVGHFAEQMADRVERFSHYLRDADLNELLSGFEHWARRNPALFLGGCAAGGLLLARFLKSSPQRRHAENRRRSSRTRRAEQSVAEHPFREPQRRRNARGEPIRSPYAPRGESPANPPGMVEPSRGGAHPPLASGPWEEP
jgi:hypothetical protein